MKVLAVDDSRTMRSLLRQALETNGIEVETAEDGQDGLETLKAASPAPDVVITDINMPVMDGFGFIENVRADTKWRGLPILVLSTESAPELKARARDAGATGWIVKPFDETKLVNALHRVTAAV